MLYYASYRRLTRKTIHCITNASRSPVTLTGAEKTLIAVYIFGTNIRIITEITLYYAIQNQAAGKIRLPDKITTIE